MRRFGEASEIPSPRGPASCRRPPGAGVMTSAQLVAHHGSWLRACEAAAALAPDRSLPHCVRAKRTSASECQLGRPARSCRMRACPVVLVIGRSRHAVVDSIRRRAADLGAGGCGRSARIHPRRVPASRHPLGVGALPRGDASRQERPPAPVWRSDLGGIVQGLVGAWVRHCVRPQV